MIQGVHIKDRPDLVEFYHGCCDEDKQLCDSIGRLPIADNLSCNTCGLCPPSNGCDTCGLCDEIIDL